MASENIFIEAAITTSTMIAFFSFLYYTAEGFLWKRIWLLAAFCNVLLAFEIMRRGFQNIVVMTDLAGWIESFTLVFMWILVLIIAVMLLETALWVFDYLRNAVEGRIYNERDKSRMGRH